MKKFLSVYFGHKTIPLYFLVFFALCFTSYQLDLFSKIPLFFILPVFIAPFVEWFAHKILLHKIITPSQTRAFAYQKKLHYNHHELPLDTFWTFAPLSSVIILMVAVFLLFSLLGFSWEAGIAGLTTGMGYFLVYEWVHLAHHMPEYIPWTTYGKFLKKAHMWHHYANEQYWWGVTSHLADKVLGTFPDPKDVPHSPTVRTIIPRS
jgi:sterol desaturase/sphingolipid hydroxylase (fatty acid hydroxylase superfamily)